MTLILKNIDDAKKIIKQGGIIAYPTESIYGLGCDPFNHDAVKKLLQIKQRPESEGLILLISEWEQLKPLIKPISKAQLETIRATWPGHTTWIFPKSDLIPNWISGKHQGVAIRMTAHPIAKALCNETPLVSSSANIRYEIPATTINNLNPQIKKNISGFVEGKLGAEPKPSTVIDLLSGTKLR